MKSHIVYLVTNLLNGDEYVGASKHAIDIRKRRHHYDAKRHRVGCKRFWAALRKYKEDDFRWEILASGLSLEEAMSEEVRQIDLRKPVYNIAKGGRGLVGLLRTPEWTEKIATANRGRKATPESIARMKMAKRPMKRPIVCLDDGQWFSGIKAAAIYYKIGYRSITAVCNGDYFRAGGKRFADCAASPSPEEIKALLIDNLARDEASKANVNSDKKRSVVRISDGFIFDSIKDAAMVVGLSRSRVQQICNGVGGGFKYADADSGPIRVRATTEQLSLAKTKKLAALSRGVEKNKKKVLCLDSGEIYNSISEAARTHKVHISALSASIYRSGKTAGLTFQFMEAV